MKHLIRRPSPAMVVACLALGLALGGTSYAAVKLPKNSVGAKQLKKNAVTSPKIKANAVTGAKVKSNAITGADVNESSLAKVPAAVAADTAALATTATTATTATNANAVSGDTVRRFTSAVVTGGAQTTVLNLNGLIITMTCPAGAVTLRANNNSGAAAQFRFDAHGQGAGQFNGGFAELRGRYQRRSRPRQQPRVGLVPLRSAQRDRCDGAVRLAQRRSRRGRRRLSRVRLRGQRLIRTDSHEQHREPAARRALS